MSELSLLLNLVKINVGNSVLAIENLGNLLESRALGLNVEEVDEDKLDGIPESVEQHEVPVVGESGPSKLVGLAGRQVS